MNGLNLNDKYWSRLNYWLKTFIAIAEYHQAILNKNI